MKNCEKKWDKFKYNLMVPFPFDKPLSKELLSYTVRYSNCAIVVFYSPAMSIKWTCSMCVDICYQNIMKYYNNFGELNKLVAAIFWGIMALWLSKIS